MTKLVMGISRWPEEEKDFEVFNVRTGESDEDAIARAKEAYSESDEFYVIDLRSS